MKQEMALKISWDSDYKVSQEREGLMSRNQWHIAETDISLLRKAFALIHVKGPCLLTLVLRAP